MAGWHQTIIIGNVGRDAELRYTQEGTAVANFSVAVTERWNDSETSEKREKTTWYRVSAWRKLGETAAQYIKKGMQIMVEGKCHASAFTRNDGTLAASLELTASNFQFLGKRDENGEAPQEDFAPVSDDKKENDIPF